MTKATKTETALRNCRCSIYTAVTAEITDEHGEMIDIEEYGTGCTATTRNEFAQGHDAKLKSFLIAAGVAGYEVARVEGGMRISNDALGMAQEYGFAHMVKAGIEKGVAKREAAQKRADAKHEKAAAKAAGKAPKAEAPVVVEPVVETAKIGRWEYQGVVTEAGFAYTDKQGNAKVTDKYTLIRLAS